MTSWEDARLSSTPLSCGQLSAATYGDPTHNDLMSALDPNGTTAKLSDHKLRRLVGYRAVTATSGNRICEWSQMVDRDGEQHFFGLNFRGQILVHAIQERAPAQGGGANFIFDETLYTADGMVAEQRRPVRGAPLWQTADGYTRFDYQEIDPTNNSGWDEWLPVFWARRMNVVRVEEHPRTGEILDFDEAADAFVKSAGRYQTFAYEPLFNQLRIVETGSLRPTATAGRFQDIPHENKTLLFDYQELSTDPAAPAERSLGPLLEHLATWGFAWAHLPGGALDYDKITSWQLPLAFYGEDVNGDGAVGATGQNLQNYQRGRGVPIVAWRSGNNPAGDLQAHVFAWAPNGQLAQWRGPDGS
jgi:hypothetical protein